MAPCILSIGKALPSYSLSQSEIAQLLVDLLRLDDEEAWMLEKIYKNSCIDRRYSVLPAILHPSPHESPLGMSARNEIYKREAPLLAEKAAIDVINQWRRPSKDITHIISVSCTGAITPGLEFKLARSLGLNPSVSRLGINMMGCFGAFKGLSVAHKIACENTANRVLVVCTELCSLHFRYKGNLESLIVHSLFADGSSAAIVGSDPIKGERSLYEITKESSYALADSEQEMTWDASDLGFDMTLSSKVPYLIEQNIKKFVDVLMGSSIGMQELDWALHPGGKAILEAIEKSLNLNRPQTNSSWEVLSRYGNLSSATLLYVLENLIEKKTKNPWTIGLGFGPGLSIEGMLFRNVHNVS